MRRKFPSPYGVSFILMGGIFIELVINGILASFRLLTEYHSFLFIEKMEDIKQLKDFLSFRLLTEYHSFLFNASFNNCNSKYLLVSVSLRSIIHSYNFQSTLFMSTIQSSFRLLTEYHSFFFILQWC